MSDRIEVGASLQEGNLRYWRAKEAMRQGELRLSAQATARTALEGRATAITGWAAAGLLALSAAAATSTTWPGHIGIAVAALALFGAAAICVHVARPRPDWSTAGYDPQVILADELQTELEVLESIAYGLTPGIQLNSARLADVGAALRWAGWLLVAAPIGGAISYVCARVSS